MQIRVIRATLSFVVFLLAILFFAGNAALADQSLRIARPKAESTTSPLTAPVAVAPNSCCTDAAKSAALSSSLPADGLYARWQAEFTNPTLCPVRLCHGSCARSTMSCKFIKPILDSLLDAYIPEEQPVEALLNFRCCAGFTEDD